MATQENEMSEMETPEASDEALDPYDVVQGWLRADPEEWARGMARMADIRLDSIKHTLEEVEQCMTEGDLADALKGLEKVRWWMGEAMHPLARAVAALGTDPTEVLRETDSHYITPHRNDYLPPFVPVPSPYHNGDESPEGQKQHKRDWANWEKRVKRSVERMVHGVHWNLVGCPEYDNLLRKKLGDDYDIFYPSHGTVAEAIAAREAKESSAR